MIISGDHGYGGAAALAAEASLKTGGLTSVATQPQHVGAILARSPGNGPWCNLGSTVRAFA